MHNTRNLLVTLFSFSSIALAPAALAQQTDRTARVGWIDVSYDAKKSPRAAAKPLGLTIPPSILLRADRVIE